MIQVHRILQFRATHAYGRSDWRPEENARVFGPLIHPHAHDFRIEVVVTGPPDPVTGFLVDLAEFDQLLDRHLLTPLSGAHLNDAIPILREGVRQPSTEVLASWMAGQLVDVLPDPLTLVRLTVWESDTLGSSFVKG
jgi:6-pyruvoyltetrahydropterin/6-carboxytetrahydropterin synthase